MNILVVGPGAIGCLFGSVLARAGHQVLMLARDPKLAATISSDGVRVTDSQGSWTIGIHATRQLPDQYHPQLVLICVKSYDTDAAAERIIPLIMDDTIVVSLQNGLRNPQQMATHFGAARIVCVSTAHGATTLAPGYVHHAGRGPTRAGAFTVGGEPLAQQVADCFTAAGIPTTKATHTTGMLWSKAIINAGVNPVTALADLPNGALLERPNLMDTAQRAVQEAQQVAEAKGIPLLYPDGGIELVRLCTETRKNLSSMLQDRRRGRQTEIDAINGVIVEEARTLGIDTPVNDMLIRQIRSA